MTHVQDVERSMEMVLIYRPSAPTWVGCCFQQTL